MTITISERFQLRPLKASDAEDLHSLIERNRSRLARWLGWAATQTFDDTAEFIREAEAHAAGDRGFQAAIVLDGIFVGVIGFSEIDRENRSTRVGYWLGAEYEGRGVMTEAVRAMVDHALGVWKLNRVEIRVATENRRSRAIPEHLGFRQEEGILRGAERVGDCYLDQVVYSMRADDWSAQKTGDSV